MPPSQISDPQSFSPHANLRNAAINYSDGWFFVTTQVAHNKSVFGVIAGGRCELNELGRRVEACWERMFERHPEAYRDEFVVMPNHFHAVIRIHPRPTNKPNHLSYLQQGFKSYTTHLYHGLVRAGACPDIGTQLWQTSYYDNLITTRAELENIRAYIRNNPARWEADRFGPVTTHHAGNLELLNQPLVAYVASGQDTAVPPHDTATPAAAAPLSLPVAPPSLPAVALPRGAGPPCPAPAPVISSFTSAQERRVLARCLATRRAFVHVMPGGIPPVLPPAIASACAEGWALLLSPFPPGTSLNKQRAIWCNRYVLNHAEAVWCGTVRPGGTLETLLRLWRPHPDGMEQTLAPSPSSSSRAGGASSPPPTTRKATP